MKLSIFTLLLLGSPLIAADEGAEAAAEKATESFPYVGSWQGRKVDSKDGVGIGTCVLISPNWILTAAHVASPLSKDPASRIVTIEFPGAKRRAIEAHLADGADIALARLDKPITEIKPASILSMALEKDRDGEVTFTIVGTSGGRHAFPAAKGYGEGVKAFRPKDSSSSVAFGKAGDSGGAWMLQTAEVPLLFGIIHGGIKQGDKAFGVAVQPAAFQPWIIKTLAKTGDVASWCPMKEPAKDKK
ncbi:MAG: trypsin-like peptidase domain-containing protein [Verrucomicrobiaceae bacterium]|nr:trypsin-like peptidase domain-containing protein [Verrucomicrobiaceae bacterium]